MAKEHLASIEDVTEEYEAWLSQHIPLIKDDLKHKHVEMAADAFAFFRATVYRWMQIWDKYCPDEKDSPRVLSVGDVHLENFGTWRDAEGRLVWGLNDFDEATVLPYTADIIRLATSVSIAIETHGFQAAASVERACESILTGYTDVMDAYLEHGRNGVSPIVLAEQYVWLRRIAAEQASDPGLFWRKLEAEAQIAGDDVPADVVQYVADLMPHSLPALSWRRRQAGLGSLGRPRYLGMSHHLGGMVAREAKALAPSSWLWQHPDADSIPTLYREILDRAVRSPDPYVKQRGAWIVRRLAPDCFKLRLDRLPKDFDYDILQAMGRETANVHVGTPMAIKSIRKDLKSRKEGWLSKAGSMMAGHVCNDWKHWCDSGHCKI